MTRALPRANFSSPKLVRLLAHGTTRATGAEPKQDFAAKLGQWLHVSHAIDLHAVLDANVISVLIGMYLIYLVAQLLSLGLHKRLFNFAMVSIFRIPCFTDIQGDNKGGLDVIWNFILLFLEIVFLSFNWGVLKMIFKGGF